MAFKKMGHAAIQVRNLEKSLTFYREVLGFQGQWTGDADWANLRLGPDDLSLVRQDGAVHPPHLGLRVDTEAELVAEHARLKEAGVKVGMIKKHRDGSHSFYFADPDGNILEGLWDG